jgi:3-deoxy-D-manno-octulosonate 8-phosphate phosphatase (KDO 8-P phosphatase)
MTLSPDVIERMRQVRLMLFDVDGILTDGTLYIGQTGELMKGFHVRDGLGLKLLAEAGVEVGLLSSRRSGIVEMRAAELDIALVRQGEGDKAIAFEAMLRDRNLTAAATGYMGDDFQDLPVLTRCGFAATVPEAPAAVREKAHLVTTAGGGRGAVRELCELILTARGMLASSVARYLA